MTYTSIIDQLFTFFAESRTFRECPQEQGAIIWQNRSSGDYELDSISISRSESTISLYPPHSLERILETLDPDSTLRYGGDFHTHPSRGVVIDQFPSPDDLSDPTNGTISVVCDYWGRTDPDDRPLQLAPRMQIVQSTWYGDVFLMERNPNRKAFRDFAEQERYTQILHQQLSERYLKSGAKFLFQRQQLTRLEFDQIVSQELVELNKILSGRATISIFRNSHAELASRTLSLHPCSSVDSEQLLLQNNNPLYR